MRKSILLLLALFLGLTTYAQEREFRMGKGGVFLAGAVPESGGYGIGFMLEPGLMFTDNLALNVRLERIRAARDMKDHKDKKVIQDITMTSYGGNVQYYFGKKKRRVFAGFGAARFYPSVVDFNQQPGFNTGKADPIFGFYPRIGFVDGHFSVIVDYNLIKSSSFITDNRVHPSFAPSSVVKNNYLSFKIGVAIGGTKK